MKPVCRPEDGRSSLGTPCRKATSGLQTHRIPGSHLEPRGRARSWERELLWPRQGGEDQEEGGDAAEKSRQCGVCLRLSQPTGQPAAPGRAALEEPRKTDMETSFICGPRGPATLPSLPSFLRSFPSLRLLQPHPLRSHSSSSLFCPTSSPHPLAPLFLSPPPAKSGA